MLQYGTETQDKEVLLPKFGSHVGSVSLSTLKILETPVSIRKAEISSFGQKLNELRSVAFLSCLHKIGKMLSATHTQT